ncbi:MAG: sigma-70 family RNA polymerase sigma factor, partial [Tepidisphaeraceae bacterium]
MDEFDRVVAQHGPAVWQTICRLVKNREDAADCFQETFVQYVQFAGKTNVEYPLALLKRIATRRAIDWIRKRSAARRKQVPLDEQYPSREGEAWNAMAAEEFAESLVDAPSRSREIAGPAREIFAGHSEAIMTNNDVGGDDGILEIATRHLRDSRAIDGPSAELIGRTVAAMRLAPRQRTKWAKMALMAASLLFAIIAGSWLVYRGSGEITFADVMQQVMQTKSIQFKIVEAAEREPQKSARFYVEGLRGRIETDDGLIIIGDGKTGDTITLDSKAHVACRSTEPINGNCDIYAELRQIAAQIPKSIGKKEFNGRMLDGFSGTITLSGKSGV